MPSGPRVTASLPLNQHHVARPPRPSPTVCPRLRFHLNLTALHLGGPRHFIYLRGTMLHPNTRLLHTLLPSWPAATFQGFLKLGHRPTTCESTPAALYRRLAHLAVGAPRLEGSCKHAEHAAGIP